MHFRRSQRPSHPFVALLLTSALALPAVAQAQVYVAPRNAGKSTVHYFPHDWNTIDLLVDEPFAEETAGGVRLFFYEQERPSAERAAASIEASYRYLVDAFGYAPSRRFPYVLYSSYQEFLRTNLFPMQEGVLGVTSTKSLEVTLPYFGDHQRFERVSTHELAHQFTIQKVRDVSRKASASRDPLPRLPLWFIEGIAEYYAQRGLDPETRMLLRDLVANPDALRGYGVPGFFEDYPWVGLWTYKVGQARAAFLEETYGEGTIQRILEATPELYLTAGVRSTNRHGPFATLIGKVVDESPDTVSARFDEWLKRGAFTEWLDAEQGLSDLDSFEGIRGYLTSLTASPDGSLLLYRSADLETGQSRLTLVDPRAPWTQRRVAIEGVPGAESLHGIDDRNFAIGDGVLVYVSESRGHDVITWRTFTHEAEERQGRKHRIPAPSADPEALFDKVDDEGETWWSVKLRVGSRDRYRLASHDLVAASSIALSPDGTEAAFVGLSRAGSKDLYVLAPTDGRHAELRQLTNDRYAERQVAWGPAGVVYTSDATEHGHYNLFVIDPSGDVPPTRLTTEARDHVSPTVTTDGRVFFLGDGERHGELLEWTAAGVIARSDLPTGLYDPTPGPDDSLRALLHHQGEKLPAQIGTAALLSGEPTPQSLPEELTPHAIDAQSLDLSSAYQPFKPSNWRVENLLGFLGAGTGGIYGQLYFTAGDILRDRGLIANVALYGDIRLTDGALVYVDQHSRLVWGMGPFQSLRFRFDRTFEDVLPRDVRFQSIERFYGGLASARWPMGRFVYLQADLAFGGVQYLLFDLDADWLADGDANGTGTNLFAEWIDLNGKHRLQGETTVRLGVDTLRHHYKTGPTAGSSAMIEGTLGVQPVQSEAFGSVRLDASHYITLPLVSGANLGLRLSGGSAIGGQYARSFYLYSYDTLRGVQFGDADFLLGRSFAFSSAELQVPLDSLLRLAIASSVEGIVGLDFGAVADDPLALWDHRVLDLAVGGNVVFGPLVLRIHFAKPLDVGAPLPPTRDPWVTNISLGWLGGSSWF